MVIELRRRASPSPRMQVFISSVMAKEDLRHERDAVHDAISSIPLTVPWAFEYSDAESDDAETVYRREVPRSDLFVLIVSNSHTPAVRDELELAERTQRPILAFVRLIDERATPEREEVLEWLAARVKYRHFKTPTDLYETVVSSVSGEIIRGYRGYRERLQQEDVHTLLQRVSSPPSLVVYSPDPSEIDTVREVLGELRSWYPEIDAWIPAVTNAFGVATGEVRVAKIGGEIAAVAISRDKDSQVRKFSTVYVRPDHRGESVGPHLIHEEVRRAARDGIRKAYVTFADELYPQLYPTFERYGFVAEGVSAGRYRVGSGEWVLSKTFVYDEIDASRFADFVELHMVREHGGRVQRRVGGSWLARLPRGSLWGELSPRDVWFVTSTGDQPEEEYARAESRLRGRDWLFVSAYGRVADASHWSHKVNNWIDGEDIRSRFYPVDIVTPDEDSIICTIRPAYADALMPRAARPALFAPDRLQVRPDNVFYRAPDRYKSLRRGSRIFFYVSAPEMRVRGSARLRELRVTDPESSISEYGEMGILKFGDLQAIAAKHRGNVLALAFDWYEEHQHPLGLPEVAAVVPGYTPVAARRITFGQRREIMSRARTEANS